MSLTSDTMAFLVAKGIKPEDLIEVVRVIENDRNIVTKRVTVPVTAEMKSPAAKKQSEYRLRKKANAVTAVTPEVTSAVTSGNTVTDPLPLEVSPIGSPKDNIKPLPLTPSPPSLRSGSVSVQARELDREFEDQFWPRWPSRTAKAKAKQAYPKARQEASLEEILEGVRRYSLSKPADRDWMHPATFLNGKRWLDEYSAPKAQFSRSGKNGFSEVGDYLRQRIEEDEHSGGETGPDHDGSEDRDGGAERSQEALPFEAYGEPLGRILDFRRDGSGGYGPRDDPRPSPGAFGRDAAWR